MCNQETEMELAAFETQMCDYLCKGSILLSLKATVEIGPCELVFKLGSPSWLRSRLL